MLIDYVLQGFDCHRFVGYQFQKSNKTPPKSLRGIFVSTFAYKKSMSGFYAPNKSNDLECASPSLDCKGACDPTLWPECNQPFEDNSTLILISGPVLQCYKI